MSKILYPIEYCDIPENEIPLFLIGPIRGTYDWQDEVAQKISNLISPDSHVVFINPRRQDEKKFLTPGFETRFSRQRDWELYYIEKALTQGLIISYAAKQTIEIPNNGDGMQKKSYASTTRGEYGIFCGKGVSIKDRLIIGIDEEFPEKTIVKYDFETYFGKNFKIDDSLDELVLRTVEAVNQIEISATRKND